VPENVQIIPVNAALAARIDTELGEAIGFFWSGYDRFEALGYGWCSLIGDQIGSVAVTDGADNHSASIGVVTAPEFRRQGLAELTCSAFIADTLIRGLQPVWECEVRNTASKYLAEKLGFVERNRFAQLSIAAPPYGPLTLSHGLWQAESVENGIIAWRRADPA
jgi:RimJ/RimL family protein N-acetyltransferase